MNSTPILENLYAEISTKLLLMLGRNPNNNREFTVEDKSELVTHGRQYYQVYRHDRLIASWYVDRSHGLDLHFFVDQHYDPHNYTPPAATPPTTDDNWKPVSERPPNDRIWIACDYGDGHTDVFDVTIWPQTEWPPSQYVVAWKPLLTPDFSTKDLQALQDADTRQKRPSDGITLSDALRAIADAIGDDHPNAARKAQHAVCALKPTTTPTN